MASEGEESDSTQASTVSQADVKQYVYHVGSTGEVVKVEEVDDKTGERHEIPEVKLYVYHIKGSTGEVVKVEEMDSKTGERKETPMQYEGYGFDPYSYYYDPYGLAAYGYTGYEGYDPYYGMDPATLAAYGYGDPYGMYAYDPYGTYGYGTYGYDPYGYDAYAYGY